MTEKKQPHTSDIARLLTEWETASSLVAQRWKAFNDAVERKKELESAIVQCSGGKESKFKLGNNNYHLIKTKETSAITQSHLKKAINELVTDKASADKLFKHVVDTRPIKVKWDVVKKDVKK